MKKRLWVSSLVIMLSLMACTIAMASNWEDVEWYGCETTLTLQIQTPYTSKGDLLYKQTTVKISPAYFYIVNTPSGSNTTLTGAYQDGTYAAIAGDEVTTEIFRGVITNAATINTDNDATGSGKAHHDTMHLFGLGTYHYTQDYYSGLYDGFFQLTCADIVLNDNASDITTTISASGCTLSGGVNPSTTAFYTATGYTFTGTLSPCTMTPGYEIP